MSDALPILPADPKANYLAHQAEIDAAIRRVLDSGWYILGAEVRAFEAEFAQYTGARHAVGVASGTDALHLALRACGVGAGDAVLTVSHTAVATVAAIELAGALPVLVDVDPGTYTMDADALAAAIERYRDAHRLRAVVPVHLYGHPADMAAIVELARRHGLWVIEDCAQAHGATIGGRKVGTWGDIAAFSFYPTKNLGALGDGGAVVTNDTAQAEQVRLLREYGWRERYISSAQAGTNSRLDEMQAAILRVKLHHLDAENARRRALAQIYATLLEGLPLTLPTARAGVEHVYHLYVIRCDGRDALRAHLHAGGIGTAIHYPAPVHRQPAYAGRLPGHDHLAQTDALAPHILSLPMHPQLSDEQARQVCMAIAQHMASQPRET